MGKSSSVTVGHKILMGGHLVFCHGPIDSIDTIEWDSRAGWKGLSTGGTINVDAENLFGGSKESSTTPGFGGGDNSDADGVSGKIDILMGEPTQLQNSYLQSILGPLIPAFRGVVSFVLNQMYLGNSTTLRPLAAWGSRIHVKDDGQPQWYDEKAAIASKQVNFEYDGVWKYKVVAPTGAGAPGVPAEYISPTYDDSAWSEGAGGFGNVAPPGSTLAANTFVSSGTVGKAIWIRKKIVIAKSATTNLALDLYHDDGVWMWWNGEPIPTVQQANYFHSKANIPYDKILASNVLVVQVLDAIPGGVATDIFAGVSIEDTSVPHCDINPAHFLRECFTSTIWGLNRPEYEINDDSFVAAADQLFAEGMGISLLWDRQRPVEELIDEIKRHIDADIYIDNDGLVKIKLIRDDYDYNDLEVFDKSNTIRVERIASTPERELINAVTVVYWDATTGKDASVQIPHAALVQMQGKIIPTTVRYDFFTNAEISTKKGEYDLRVATSSLITFQVVTNLLADEYEIGDRFILNRPDRAAANMVVRILEIDLGNSLNNEIIFTVTQEVFSLPAMPVMAPSPDAVWENPVQPATPSPARLVFEQPFYELVQHQGQTEVEALLAADDSLAMLGVAAIRPSSVSLNAQVIVDDGADYHEAGVLDYCPSALLATAMNYTTKNITFTDEIDMDMVSTGTHCQIDDELFAVEALDLVARTATLGRGVLDTVPAKEHLVGARIFFWDYYNASDSTAYSDGENVDVKVLTNSSMGRLPAAAAPVDSIEFVGRAARPYPPGKLRVNGVAYGTTIGASAGLSVEACHRDRLLQTAGTLQDTNVGDIGPEPGTTYTFRIYSALNALLRTISALAAPIYNYTTSAEEVDMGGIGGGLAIDPFWDKTVLLLNMNGANGSTTFIDSSPNFGIPAGDVHVTTSPLLFGDSVAAFDGAGDSVALGNMARIVGYGDFFVECMIYKTSNAPYQPIVGQNKYGTYFANTWTMFIESSGTKLAAQVSNNGTPSAPNTFTAVSSIAVPNNSWVHVAMGLSGTTLSVFINGAVVATTTVSGTFSDTGGNPTIGTDSISASTYFSGYIGDLRVTKFARNTSGFTPPAARLGKYERQTNHSDFKLLLTFEAANNATKIADQSDLALAVTLYGTAKITTAQSWGGSSSLELDGGSNSMAWVAYHSSQRGSGSNITIDCRARTSDITRAGVIASNGLPSSSTRAGWLIGMTSAGKLYATGFTNTGAVAFTIVAVASISVNTWYHVELVRNGTQWQLFQNGVSIGTDTEIAVLGVSNDVVSIGRDQNTLVTWLGQIDEFAIRDSAVNTANFTPPSVSYYPIDPHWSNVVVLMPMTGANNSTQFENIAETSRTGTVAGNAQISTAQYKFSGASGLFDGTLDSVSFPHVPLRYELLADFTLDCWVRPSVTISSYRHIISKASKSGVTNPHWAIGCLSSGVVFAQLGRAQVSLSRNTVSSTTALAINTWYHIRFIRTGGTLKLFINGVQEGGDVAVSITPLDSSTSGVWVGNYDGGVSAESWQGNIDDVELTVGGARSTSNFTPPTFEAGKYIPALNSQLRFELEAVRDGLVSYQKHNITVVRS